MPWGCHGDVMGMSSNFMTSTPSSPCYYPLLAFAWIAPQKGRSRHRRPLPLIPAAGGGECWIVIQAAAVVEEAVVTVAVVHAVVAVVVDAVVVVAAAVAVVAVIAVVLAVVLAVTQAHGFIEMLSVRPCSQP